MADPNWMYTRKSNTQGWGEQIRDAMMALQQMQMQKRDRRLQALMEEAQRKRIEAETRKLDRETGQDDWRIQKAGQMEKLLQENEEVRSRMPQDPRAALAELSRVAGMEIPGAIPEGFVGPVQQEYEPNRQAAMGRRSEAQFDKRGLEADMARRSQIRRQAYGAAAPRTEPEIMGLESALGDPYTRSTIKVAELRETGRTAEGARRTQEKALDRSLSRDLQAKKITAQKSIAELASTTTLTAAKMKAGLGNATSYINSLYRALSEMPEHNAAGKDLIQDAIDDFLPQEQALKDALMKNFSGETDSGEDEDAFITKLIEQGLSNEEINERATAKFGGK